YHDLHSMLGTQLLNAYPEGAERERARDRLRQVDALPVGQTLPATEFHLRNALGRALIVQVSSAPVEFDNGRATLSIYTDDTERREAEQSVARSEALLSHLVATSPDVITLTDMANGRYAMV